MFLALICVDFLALWPSFAHCCRVLTLALARLCCIRIWIISLKCHTI